MSRKIVVKPNLYLDSASLMVLAQEAKDMEGVKEAVAVMATEANKELLDNVGLLDESVSNASPRDLVLAILAEGDEISDRAMAFLEEGLAGNKKDKQKTSETQPSTIAQAIDYDPDLNLALISVPGRYAAFEAKKALDAGLHVMLFSDNVSLEDEVKLKKLAKEKDLLLMGPDCGTAIISGAPLAFANVVSRGSIGVVAAAGTGLQEVTCLIDRWGAGISQAIGTGGRDVKQEVGGMQFLRGIEALLKDDSTEVILLTGKPPAVEVEKKVLELVSGADKPIVVNLLGGNQERVEAAGGIFANSLEDAAGKAVEKSGKTIEDIGFDPQLVDEAVKGMSSEQKWLRGLYTGGTLCYEALLLLDQLLGDVHSNTPIRKELGLRNSGYSFAHTAIDLGEDEFTQGRPHPMIEPSIRGERIVQEAKDSEVAVMLLDMVLGYGAHAEPVDAISDELEEAMTAAEKRGGKLVVVASVTGTEKDPQKYSVQVEKLRKLGVYVLPSNYQAVMFAASVINRLGGLNSNG